jgi:hypothetical protein
MLTRVDPEALRSPHSLEELERRAMEAIGAQCPQVKWIASYAVFGPYDYVSRPPTTSRPPRCPR